MKILCKNPLLWRWDDKRKTLGCLLFALSLFLPNTCASLPASPKSTKPNVIIILTDDQGYGDLSCHGNPVLRTPHLDRLHEQSIRLTNFHVAPMCTPTRSQLLSGRDALANGAFMVCSGFSFMRPGLPTMAEIFARNGYRTGIFGKWHLGESYPHRPQDRGFQEVLIHKGWGITSVPDHWNNDYFDDFFVHNGETKQYQGYCTDVWFSEMMKWISGPGEVTDPFFAYLSLNAPHGPHYVEDEYREPYGELDHSVASFFGMIANIDENIGKLDAMLRSSGLYENTILIFMTDNGGTAGTSLYNAGMRGAKGSLYDGGHRVPCFLRWPAGGLYPPGDYDELAQIQDLVPTLIDLCGFNDSPAGFDGISLAGLLTQGEQSELADRMFVVQYGRQPLYRLRFPEKWDACILWKHWRLVNGDELYDLENDPGQERSVFAEAPEIAKKMRDYYQRWWERVEPIMNEPVYISIGAENEETTVLTSHDWMMRNTADVIYHIREGINVSGAWNVFVERDGQYEIGLWRWPKEANAKLTDALPAFQAVDDTFPEGKALPIRRANLRIGRQEYTQEVGSEDLYAAFEIRLKSGPTQLQTWFYDDAGQGNQLCGAYFVYVRKIKE